MPRWIWQHPEWSRLTWQADTLAPLLRQVTLAQGAPLDQARSAESAVQAEFTLDAP